MDGKAPETQHRLNGSKTIVSALVMIRSAIDVALEKEMAVLKTSSATIDNSFVDTFGHMALSAASENTEEAYERAMTIFGNAPKETRIETVENVLHSVFNAVVKFGELEETGKEFVDEHETK